MKEIWFFLFCFTATILMGQPPQNRQPLSQENKGEIFGNISDSISKKPVSYVRILAIKQPENTTVAGTITAENGNFSLSPLPVGEYDLKIDFVGYKTKFIKNIVLTKDELTHSTKTITIVPDVLQTVEVVSGVPTIEYEIDRKVLNVEDQANTDGQSAVEVLQNMPSVSVSSDGTVSLRGSSSFTLLIDGIPTIMDASDALATLPASSIKNIEIITNPSAKYDAEGTSGVINIITKKSKLEGVSCLINGNIGRFDNYGGDIALNIKKKKITYDLSAKLNSRGRPRDEYTERVTTYSNDSIQRLVSKGEANWKRSTWGVGGGIQWTPNNSHTLVVRTDFNSTLMQPYSDLFYEEFLNGNLVSSFNTDQHNNIDMFNNTSSLYYQYNIKRNKAHHISFKAISNIRSVEQFDTTLSYTANEIRQGNLYTETGPSNSFRFNIDYQLPLKKERKLEVGLQSQIGRSGDVGKNYTYNLSNSQYELNPLFSSDVDYVRNIQAAYSIFSGKYKSFGYQLGVRAEHTYRTISSTAAVDFTEINRLDLFPSTHLSYRFSNKVQVLLSYSRRIERPRSYFFEPFITWESPFNVRSGNPNLNPQYINVVETSIIKPLSQKGFISLEAYFRQNQNVINRIASVYEPGIILSQPYNIGSSQAIGLEATINYKPVKWWKFNVGLNAYQFNLNGNLNGIDYSRQSFNWAGNVTNSFTFKQWNMELVSRYRSGSITAQGTSLGAFNQDISLRRSILKKRITFTLQGRNVLGTARRVDESITENVVINSKSIPLAPQVMFAIAIKLNNYQKVYQRNEQLDDF